MTWRNFPSIGFAIVIAVYTALGVFLCWGIGTPDLDRIWMIHHLMKVGELKRLDSDDAALLLETTERYPNLATALLGGGTIGMISANLDGWLSTPCATIVRTPAARDFDVIFLDVQTPQDLLPLAAVFSDGDGKTTIKIEKHGEHEVKLPAASDGTEVFELCLEGRGLDADPSVLGTRISFGESK